MKQLFIDGRFVDARSTESIDVVNPATEERIDQIAEASAEDLDRAVAAARAALEGPWANITPSKRGRLLWKLGDLMEADLDELAQLETINVGKPISTTRQREVRRAADVLRYFAGWTTKIHGETLPTAPNVFTFTVREPVGVVGAIVPWNFPLILAMYKTAPALAAGNTVVLKPSEYSPLTALRFGQLCREVGLPPGVVNVITGGPPTGERMAKHPGIDKIAFTGSVATGQSIMRHAADTMKRLHLELGGKSPNVVFADADLDAASAHAFNGIFYNAGQVCVAGSRLFVERRAHDAFLEKLLARAREMVPGDPMDEKTTMGPIVSQRQRDRILGYFELGKREGARAVIGGDQPSRSKGYWVNPTIFDGVRNTMTIAREEIFGPVLSVISFDAMEQAVGEANDSPYGLAAGVWTRDIKRAHRVARALKAGIVWVNCFYQMDPASPFGGYKKSGFGRDLGRQAMEQYLETKTIWMNLE